MSNVKKYTKFKNSEKSYIFYKTLPISIFCGKFRSKHKIIFKEDQSSEVLKIPGLIKNR